jgi:ATP phosphoribosyltransferase
MIHAAIAKGRIAKTVFRRLMASGYKFSEYSEESRKLIFTDDSGSLKVTLVKSPDIAVYVRRGAADVGIVGKDVLVEEGESDVYELMDLGIGKCRMAVAGIKGHQDVMKKRILTVASKYPNIARQYFADRFQLIDIIKLNGSVELAPLVGLSDVIVDIVETGTTLRENGLEAYDFFMNFSARLISNKVAYKMKYDELQRFMLALQKERDA